MVLQSLLAMRKYIEFDIMLGDKFIHTMRVSTLLADSVDAFGVPVFSLEKIKRHIESRLPTLKGKNYILCPN